MRLLWTLTLLHGRQTSALPHLHRRASWYRYNELEFRWAVETMWVLTRQFSISDALLSEPSVELLLSGYELH